MLVVAAQVAPLGAQSSVELGRVRECARCILRPHLLLNLGEASGDGIIEANHAQVRQGDTGGFAVFHIGNSRVLEFDSRGRFLHSIGRKGRGPGEFERIFDVQPRGRVMVALDASSRKPVAMHQDGRIVSESRLGVRPGRFRMASDTSIVIASMDREPSAAGYPLHLVRIADGQVLRHFGSSTAEWNVALPFSEIVLLGSSPSTDAFWRGRPDEYQFEQWHVNGRLLRSVRGEVPWLSKSVKASRDAPQPSLLYEFGVDSADRLWTITRVADPEWRSAPRHGREGYVLSEDQDAYSDSRIDVVDLRTRRHLGTLLWDEAYVSLVQIGGAFGLQKVTYDDEAVPRVSIYRLELVSR